jgi:alcohol dehydrogenase class IV
MFEYLIDLPTKVLFGPGKIKELGANAKSFGGKAFVLMDPFLKNSDTATTILSNIRDAGMTYVDYYDVSPNPRNTVVDELAGKCVSEKCDVVIAVGGGSCIDSAKVVAIVATNGEKAWLYTARDNEYVALPDNKPLPFIAVPTTSGTGTEVTPYAVLNNLELHSKGVIINMVNCPPLSIVDPELTVSMPPQITALTAIDAFSHSFESYIDTESTPFSRMIALESIRLFAKSVRAACKNGEDIDARTDLSLASLYGGIAITHSPTTMPHAMGQPLSGLTDAPHGGSIACCIGQIIDWTLPHGENEFAAVAEIFDASIANLSVSEKARRLPGILEELWNDILSEEVSMRRYGLKEEQIPELADMMLVYYIMDLRHHPRMATKEDLIGIIEKCM